MSSDVIDLGQDIDLNIWDTEQAQRLVGTEHHYNGNRGIIEKAWVIDGFVQITLEDNKETTK